MRRPKLAWPRLVRRLVAGVTAEEVQRFDGALNRVRNELERRHRSGDGSDESWYLAARAEIGDAERVRARFQLDAGWTAINAARLEMISSFDRGEISAEAHAVRDEAAEKLSGWKQTSVAALLNPETNTGPIDDQRTNLVKARALIDQHSDNSYHKFRIMRRAVLITSVALAVALALLAGAVALEWVPSELVADNSPLGSWRLLLVVMCLGAIGAYLSSATQLTTRDHSVRIPDLRVGYTLMGMRPVVGAAGSVVVIVILQSALGEAITLAPTAILGVAIASGFTERFVTKTVTSAALAVGSPP